MRKFLFICSMFIATQAFATEMANPYEIKGRKINSCNSAGPTCPQDRQGPKGERGHRGEHGRRGAKGAMGSRGATGLRGATGSRGATGATGITGATGARGATGTTGATGSRGATGDSATATIPFASGTPVTLISASPTGGIETQAMLGFGVNFPVNGEPGDIVITEQSGDTSFTISRAGTIVSISATFNNLSSFEIPTGIVTVQANVYVAPSGSNLFIFQDEVDLTPTLSGGPITVGLLLQGTKALSIPVNNQDRVLVVFSATNSLGVVTGIEGFANAGLTIQ